MNYFQNILNQATCAIFWKDCDLVYRGCNQLFLDNIGKKSEQEVIGYTDYDLFPAKSMHELYTEEDQLVLSTGKPKISTVKLKTVNGFVTIFATKNLLHDEVGEIVGIIGVYHDISELKKTQDALKKNNLELKKTQKKLEKALKNSEAAVKTHRTIFENIKHHWITAVSNILAPVQILKTLHSDPESLGLIEMSETGVEQLYRHINDITNLVESNEGIPSVKSKPFNLKQLALGVKDMYAPTIFAKKVDFTLDIEKAPELVRGDEFRIERIMIYLLSNALKFEKGKNKILFSIKLIDETADSVSVSIIVKDTGKGMSDDEVARIYEPFYRVGASNKTMYKNPDQGVGLTVTKQYIEDINGQIDCNSELGVGTTFMVSLKLKKSIAPKQSIDAMKNQGDL